MIGKIHDYLGQKIFACCDVELLDTKIIFNDVTIHISSSFYGKDKINDDQILSFVLEADQINVFGKRTCDFLLSKKIITKENIIYFNETPHAQIYKI